MKLIVRFKDFKDFFIKSYIKKNLNLIADIFTCGLASQVYALVVSRGNLNKFEKEQKGSDNVYQCDENVSEYND